MTVPAAAERALVSPATAYRYFASAEDLAREAALEQLDFLASLEVVKAAVDEAGDDVHARLEALLRTLGWRMLTEQLPFRQWPRLGSSSGSPSTRMHRPSGRRYAWGGATTSPATCSNRCELH